ncbi:hypothetical protein [Peribacillus sp. Hz7]|uniref:M23 family metallopeptidase n=1 Tax=Peribacillus sp. Hz7 TaxID=3344873 RepID=UPI0035C9F8E0
MPYQYQRTPFNTLQQVQMGPLGCHGFASGAKDLGFNDMQFGEPVFAVEDGTVVFVRRDAICFSETDPNDPNIVRLIDRSTNTVRLSFNRNNLDEIRRASEMIPPECGANEIVVRGSDGFFTDYVHVLPSNNLGVGSIVQAGTLLGGVDNSSLTTGPHVHLTRYRPNPDFDPNNPNVSPFWQNGGTCNWTMFNVVGITPTPRNGWVQDEDSGNWYYYLNDIRQTNQWIQTGNTYFEVDSTGVWTGSYYFFDDTTQTWYWWDNSTQRWSYWDGTTWVPL